MSAPSGDHSREESVCAIASDLMAMDAGAFDAARTIISLLGSQPRCTRKAAVCGDEIEPHPDYYKTTLVGKVMDHILGEIGGAHQIWDLDLDHGRRVLQLKLLLNLGVVSGRTGNDFRCGMGHEYELKTCNLDNAHPCFTTSHHLTVATLNKYRAAGFIFAAFRGGDIVSVYIVHPEALEPQFASWEASLASGREHLNNPSISLSTVRKNGELIYGDPFPLKRSKTGRTGAEAQRTGNLLDTSELSSLEGALKASREKAKVLAAAKAAVIARKLASRSLEQQGELPLDGGAAG